MSDSIRRRVRQVGKGSGVVSTPPVSAAPSLVFDGTNYLASPDDASLTPSVDACTLTFWYRGSFGTNNSFFGVGASPDIVFAASRPGAGTNRVQVRHSPTGLAGALVLTNQDGALFPDGTWRFLAIRKNAGTIETRADAGSWVSAVTGTSSLYTSAVSFMTLGTNASSLGQVLDSGTKVFLPTWSKTALSDGDVDTIYSARTAAALPGSVDYAFDFADFNGSTTDASVGSLTLTATGAGITLDAGDSPS